MALSKALRAAVERDFPADEAWVGVGVDSLATVPPDAFKVVADGVNAMRGPDVGFVVITHYNRMLEYIKPDFVHVLIGGKIVKSGGPELAVAVDQHGYQPILEEVRSQGIDVELMEEAGATYVIIGHSERRHYFGESLEVIDSKVKAAIKIKITPAKRPAM